MQEINGCNSNNTRLLVILQESLTNLKDQVEELNDMVPVDADMMLAQLSAMVNIITDSFIYKTNSKIIATH